jgi:uncharacterized protein YukE
LGGKEIVSGLSDSLARALEDQQRISRIIAENRELSDAFNEHRKALDQALREIRALDEPGIMAEMARQIEQIAAGWAGASPLSVTEQQLQELMEEARSLSKGIAPYPLSEPSSSEVCEPGLSQRAELIREIGENLSRIEDRLGQMSTRLEAETAEMARRLEGI